MTLTLSQAPSQANLNQEFSVHFYYECSSCKNQKYYLRPCFYEEGETNYSGCIKNHQNQWICGSQADVNQYQEIETDNQGVWEGDLLVKAETTGNLFLKVRRYTIGGFDEDSNSVSIKILTSSSPNPSPSSSPTSSPSPATKATYKINNTKDNEGNTLSNVEIYVDDKYIHHIDEEILTFCDGCQCYDGVNCGFGSHTIKLEKSGYDNWTDTRTFNAGDNFEVNPEMNGSESSDSSSSSEANPSSPSPQVVIVQAKKASPSPSPSPKSEEEEEASFSGEVFGESTEHRENKEEDQAEEEKKNFQLSLPLIISAVGGILLLAASFPFLKPKITQFIKKIKRKKKKIRN